jgi:CheY-like chemotaxis protein/HPt (histidine-containing phosphotransfer) domain-containing protein
MDGFAVAEAIKQTPEFAASTLMMLTSARQSGDAARCRKLGLAGYLTKPFSQSSLLDAIVTALGASSFAGGKGAGSAGPDRAGALRPLRILLAEDNAVNQQLAVKLLEKRGHSIAVAGNGRNAVQQFQPGAFDLILMDVHMPVMNGFEATALIRQKEQGTGARAPIVAMTAYAMKGDRQRCLDAGMDGYVSKPVDAEELFRVIASLLPDAVQEEPAYSEAPLSLPLDLPADDVLDRPRLLASVDCDIEFLSRLVNAFFGTCHNATSEIRDAVACGDSGRLEDAAHTLKGAAGNIRAIAAFEAVERLEQSARSGDMDMARKQLEVVEIELQRLNHALVEMTRDSTLSYEGLSYEGAPAD